MSEVLKMTFNWHYFPSGIDESFKNNMRHLICAEKNIIKMDQNMNRW